MPRYFTFASFVERKTKKMGSKLTRFKSPSRKMFNDGSYCAFLNIKCTFQLMKYQHLVCETNS